jgi:ribosomal protein S28E/S33
LPDGLAEACQKWVEPAWPSFSQPMRRYLAARLFGSWLAYQGQGLRTVVAGVRLALDLVRIEAARACLDVARPLDRTLLLGAIREADRLLLHDTSREALARRLDAIAEGAARRLSRSPVATRATATEPGHGVGGPGRRTT